MLSFTKAGDDDYNGGRSNQGLAQGFEDAVHCPVSEAKYEHCNQTRNKPFNLNGLGFKLTK